MFDFCKNRKYFIAIPLVIILIGIVFLFVRGVDLDIQFKGGSIIKYSFENELDLDKAASITKKVTGRSTTAQQTIDIDSNKSTLVLSLAGNQGMSSDEQTKLETELNKEFKDNKLQLSSINNVEPYIGKRFLRKSLIAIILAMILVVLYVTIRFNLISGFTAGLTALIALFNDLIMVFLVFVIFGIPLNDAFVAVVLTILGYSVNDTIVIYDRIRENRKLYGNKLTPANLVNKSITETLPRTINTSIMTSVTMLIVLIFALVNGISSIVNFAFPLLIGIISGCFSSTTLAGPIWVMWQERKLKKAK